MRLIVQPGYIEIGHEPRCPLHLLSDHDECNVDGPNSLTCIVEHDCRCGKWETDDAISRGGAAMECGGDDVRATARQK